MQTPKIRSTAGALCAATATLWLTPAYPHAVCGDRIFPATLAIDDPGVLTNSPCRPSARFPSTPTAPTSWDASFSWTKTITPGLSVVIGDGPTWTHPGGYGWNALDTELQWQALCIPDAEFMFKVGFDIGWAGTGTGILAGSGGQNTYSPLVDFGLGFGTLPPALKYLRPFAITGEFSTSTPGQDLYKRQSQCVHVQLGVHPPIQPAVLQLAVGCDRQRLLQASDPSRRVRLSDPDLQWGGRRADDNGIFPARRHLQADKWQIALEAMIPMTGATGHGVGVIGSLDFYLDDISPTRIDQPIFPHGLGIAPGI